MRTFSVNNGKLVISRDNGEIKPSNGLNYYSKLNNLIIDGAVVSSDIDTNEAVIINTRDGEVTFISFYKNGYRMVMEYNLDFRIKIQGYSHDAVRFDQSFTDWFEAVKNTGVTPSLKFDFIDGKVVVDKDGEIITHEIGDVYTYGYLRIHTPGSNNVIFISKPNGFLDNEVISFNNGGKINFFYISPEGLNKTFSFTEAFREWLQSLNGKVINLPFTLSVAHGKLIVSEHGRIYQYEIGNTYLDHKLKLRNSNSDTTIFLDLAKDDSGVLETIEIYHDGAVMGYYVGSLSWDAYTDRIAPTTLEQSFIDWFNAVKAMPAIA